jgi:hypothetical protein
VAWSGATHTLQDHKPIQVGNENSMLHLHKIKGPQQSTENNGSNPLTTPKPK